MARRPGLGKGLNALIPESEETKKDSNLTSDQGIIQIPITQIQPNPQQPRSKIDEEALGELSASIREHGIIQPLIVSKDEDGAYTLIAGE
ncbi:MAG: ParB N-terminal domain-containing protein, partial [Brevefilum sp.]|nr:ParB N-terminal domain-containing protein [Brevefilum sp.]